MVGCIGSKMGVRGFRYVWRTWEGIESFCGNRGYWMCGDGLGFVRGSWNCSRKSRVSLERLGWV